MLNLIAQSSPNDWQPGDPIYREPERDSGQLEEAMEQLGWNRPRTDLSRPMVWTAAGAQPGPWSWLQPGRVLVGVAA